MYHILILMIIMERDQEGQYSVTVSVKEELDDHKNRYSKTPVTVSEKADKAYK